MLFSFGRQFYRSTLYSNNIGNFQESTTILNACTKKVWKLIKDTTYFDLARELKNYGTWRWQIYQLWLVLLVQSPKDYYSDCRTWRWEDEWRPSKLQHYWERPEYWEESSRHEETCCHLNSSENPSAKTDEKNSYRTLHSDKLFWAVCHLFPQRWRTLTYSVSGNHWPGGPRDMFKSTSARKFKPCVFESPTRRVFSINTSSSNTLVLFYQISSQQQHTPFSVN